MGAELFSAVGWTDGLTDGHEEDNSCFSQSCELA